MTVARQVVPGRTYFISRRCTQRQMLLRPSAEVEQIYLYCLAEAAERFTITLYAFVAMSNHQHLEIRDNLGNFPAFLAHLNKMIAKTMNAHLGRWENFWATEQPNAVFCVEAEDRFSKMIYLLANPVIDNLVDRVSDWPGASSFALHVSGRQTITVKRPRAYFGANGKMPKEITLKIERLDGFEHLTDVEWTAKVKAALEAEEEKARVHRRVSGVRVLGRRAVLETSPFSIPKTAAPRRNLRPHIACKNAVRRVLELTALIRFRERRLASLARHLAGDLRVLFPYGTYRLRRAFFLTEPQVPIPLAA